MLLSKSVIAALIATAAGGIIIGSATTYVIVNQNVSQSINQASSCDDGYVPELTEAQRKWANSPTKVRVNNPNTLSSKTPIGLPKENK